METKVVVARNWDDLVFASRNREYGAYSLRQAYLRRLFLALGLSTSMIITLLFIPRLFPQSPKIPVPSTIIFTDIKFSHPPTLPPRNIQQKSATLSKTNNLNKTVSVVSEPVEPIDEIDRQAITSISTPGGEDGEGTVSDEIGTGVTIEEMLPIVKTEPYLLNAEVMPAYEGGFEAMMKFIRKKLHYPAAPARQEIQGTVFVSFVVNGDGSVSHVSVVRGIHPECDEEARRVISLLPGWIGGRQNGSPVAVKMVLPIKFNLKN